MYIFVYINEGGLMQDKCVIKECTRKISVKKHKLCMMHYMRYLRKGSTAPKKQKMLNPYCQNKDRGYDRIG